MTSQQDLPRLPVPPLQQTIQRFLRSTTALLSDKEYKVTAKIAQDFASPGGIGERLQKILEQKALNADNWLKDWWLRVAYLGFRQPLPVYSSTGSLHPLRKISSKEEQIYHAACVIAGTAYFKNKLYRNEYPVDKMGSHPLDMSQYYSFIGSCRIPGEGMDGRREMDLDISKHPRHALVAHNGHFFTISVYDEAGVPLNQSQLVAQLNSVVIESCEPSLYPVGILTSENRDTWYQMYTLIRQAHKQNCEALDLIETSLFLVCLDGPQGDLEKSAINVKTAGAYEILHGGGTAANSNNRWCDKTIQFVCGVGGEFGLQFEHSSGDGFTVGVLSDVVEDYWQNYGMLRKDPFPPAGNFSAPKKLEFILPTQVQQSIETAKINMDKLVNDLELHCLTFCDYGKDFIKTLKVSPDSYIQAAMQLAFYRLHKVPTAQYEAAATRMFRHGRTETIRSCTPEMVNFVKLMMNKTASNSDKMKALLSAIKAHREFISWAVAGQGVDRHLLGLRLAASENGIKVPEIFHDIGYTKTTYLRLSTSQVPMRSATFLFFGPVVPDGYGICYNPAHADQILITISAWNSCPETSAFQFSEALQESLCDMKVMMTQTYLSKI